MIQNFDESKVRRDKLGEFASKGGSTDFKTDPKFSKHREVLQKLSKVLPKTHEGSVGTKQHAKLVEVGKEVLKYHPNLAKYEKKISKHYYGALDIKHKFPHTYKYRPSFNSEIKELKDAMAKRAKQYLEVNAQFGVEPGDYKKIEENLIDFLKGAAITALMVV